MRVNMYKLKYVQLYNVCLNKYLYIEIEQGNQRLTSNLILIINISSFLSNCDYISYKILHVLRLIS